MLAFEQGSFPPDHPFAPIRVVPEQVSLPPIYLLGSSGASAAGGRGTRRRLFVRGAFQRHAAAPAFAAYRAAFKPSAQFDKPHAILAVSALVAPTDDEAQFLSTSQAVSWALFHSGEERKLLAPEEAAARQLTPAQQAVIDKQAQAVDRRRPAEVKADDRGAGRSRRRRRGDGDDHRLGPRTAAPVVPAAGSGVRALAALNRAPGAR